MSGTDLDLVGVYKGQNLARRLSRSISKTRRAGLLLQLVRGPIAELGLEACRCFAPITGCYVANVRTERAKSVIVPGGFHRRSIEFEAYDHSSKCRVKALMFRAQQGAAGARVDILGPASKLEPPQTLSSMRR